MSVKISVIIPSYNAEKYIEECINSVLMQSIQDVEIICIDDGSKDDTPNIIKRIMGLNPNIIFLEQEHKGSGVARNKGIEAASGEFVAFLDSDDFYYQSDALKHMYEYAVKCKSNICGSNMIEQNLGTFSENCYSPVFGYKECFTYFNLQDIYGFTRYIYKLDFINNNNIRFPDSTYFEDPQFFLSLMTKVKVFCTVPDILYVYRHDHNERKYTSEALEQWLLGIKNCLIIAKENSLNKIYQNRIETLIHGIFFTKILCKTKIESDKIWDLLKDINVLEAEWSGYKYPAISKEFIETIKSNTDEYQSRLNAIIETGNEYIIYGAGKIGNFFYNRYCKNSIGFLGFAVTNKCDSDANKNIHVIDDFFCKRKDIFVIVAAGKQNSSEMVNRLREMQFVNVHILRLDLLSGY